MNFEFFIARRLIGHGSVQSKTKPIISISIMAIALGLIVMIASLSVVSGFQTEIRDKVIGFGSHIQVTSMESQSELEPAPISRDQPFYETITMQPGIRHIQVFGTKPGILAANDEIHGVVLKGVGADFDWEFFKTKIEAGEHFVVDSEKKTNATVLSRRIADKLSLDLGDPVIAIFMTENGEELKRKLTVSGIYNSGLGGQEFDDRILLVDLAHVQKLNGWTPDQVSGFEVLIDSYNDLERIDQLVDGSQIGVFLKTTTILDLHPDIFNWLNLQDYNVQFIIIIMLIVATINVISALLILILERTTMIGVMKALGASDWSLQKIFIQNATYLLLKGLLWGNVIGIGLCLLQEHFQLLTLNPESYYISVVPIKMVPSEIILLNVGTILICLLAMVLPSLLISRISPVKAIKFD